MNVPRRIAVTAAVLAIGVTPTVAIAHGHGEGDQSKSKSTTTTTTTATHTTAKESAEKRCRAEQKADPGAFTKKWGTNKNGRNAFGKCVSDRARDKHFGSSSSGS